MIRTDADMNSTPKQAGQVEATGTDSRGVSVSDSYSNQPPSAWHADAEESPGVPPELPPLPPGQPDPSLETPRSPRRSRMFWLLLGGAGCLVVVLLVACVGFVISLVFIVESDTSTRSPGVVPAVPDRIAPTPLMNGATQEIVFQDTLASAVDSRMIVDEDETVRYAFEEGRYLITVKPADQIAWGLVEGMYDDTVAIQVVTAVESDPAQAAGGIMFHYQDEANFYLYTISGNGFYSLELLENNQWITLIDWTPSEAIVVGSASGITPTNTLRVEVMGNRIALFVNNIRLEETVDNTFTEGEVGLATSTFDLGDGRVAFRDLVIMQPASGTGR